MNKPSEIQMDAAINAGKSEVNRLDNQKMMTCQTFSSAITELRDFVLTNQPDVRVET